MYDSNLPSPPTWNSSGTGNTDIPFDAEPSTNADKWALIALTVSIVMVLSCVPGASCLVPLAPLITGIVALAQAKNAANPARARTYGWIATIIGSLVVLAVAAIVALYGAMIIAMINEAQRQMPR